MTDVTLRETFLPKDPETIRTLVSSTGFFSPAEVGIAGELAEEFLQHGMDSGYRFVFADRGSSTIGYACYGEIPCTVGSYDLYWIAVAPAASRGGIGKLLLRHTESRVRESGGRILFIETSGREPYLPTHGFYEHCGYTLDVRVRDFYAPGDDKLIFARRF